MISMKDVATWTEMELGRTCSMNGSIEICDFRNGMKQHEFCGLCSGKTLHKKKKKKKTLIGNGKNHIKKFLSSLTDETVLEYSATARTQEIYKLLSTHFPA
jgi:hypothetical protein